MHGFALTNASYELEIFLNGTVNLNGTDRRKQAIGEQVKLQQHNDRNCLAELV